MIEKVLALYAELSGAPHFSLVQLRAKVILRSEGIKITGNTITGKITVERS